MRLGEATVQPVDKAVGLVKLTAQLEPLAASVGDSASRRPATAQLRPLDFARDVFDLFKHLYQQCLRLRCSRVIDHVWILSPILNLRLMRPRVAEAQVWVDRSRGLKHAVAMADLSEQAAMAQLEQ
jgi:hypothetical protein